KDQRPVAGRIHVQVALSPKGGGEGQLTRLEAKCVELGQEAAEVADALLVYRGGVQVRGKVPQVHKESSGRDRRREPGKRCGRIGRAHESGLLVANRLDPPIMCFPCAWPPASCPAVSPGRKLATIFRPGGPRPRPPARATAPPSPCTSL